MVTGVHVSLYRAQTSKGVGVENIVEGKMKTMMTDLI